MPGVSFTLNAPTTDTVTISATRDSSTLGSRIASQYQGAASDLQVAAIAYLAVILLVIALIVNVSARMIVANSVRRAAR